MKDIQDIKGVEALEECIKMWRLNRTSPPNGGSGEGSKSRPAVSAQWTTRHGIMSFPPEVPRRAQSSSINEDSME